MQYRAQQKRATLTSTSVDLPHEGRPANDALFDMVEESMRRLTERLGGTCPPPDLREEIEALVTLVETVTLRAEFITAMLDDRASGRLRDSLRSSAAAMQIEPELVGQEMLSTSKKLIERGTSLIATAQERINKEAHKATGYALKVCGLCQGNSGVPEGSCVVCKGRGCLVLREPAVECSRCDGKGRARSYYGKEARYQSLCGACNGMGWVTTGSE